MSLGKKHNTRGERRRKLLAATIIVGGVLLSVSTTTAVSGDISHRQAAVAASDPTDPGRDPSRTPLTTTAKSAADPMSTKPTLAETSSRDHASVCVADLRHATAAAASSLRVGTPTRQQLCADDRAAWSTIYLQSGLTYTIETLNLSDNANTELALFAPDGISLLATDDDGGTEFGASRLHVTPSTSGTYLITTRRAMTSIDDQPIRFDIRVR